MIAAGIKPAERKNLTLKGCENLAVCLEARRGKLYTRSYHYHKGRWNPRGPSCVLPIETIASGLSEGSRVAGDGVNKLKTDKLVVVPEKKWCPKASTLITLFETKNPLLKKLRRPKEFLPVYLRSSEAEERLRDKNHG